MCAKNNYEVEALNFKTYGSLFYGNMKQDIIRKPAFGEHKKRKKKELIDANMNPETNQGFIFKAWLLEQNITHPVCFVAKNTENNLKENYPMLTELYRKNGYVFLVKMPSKK